MVMCNGGKIILPAQSNINCATYVVKGPQTSQVDSFDTWLQAWNAYDKVAMAAQPSCYTEQIQFANRKFH